MGFSRQQLKQLQLALISGFPTKSSLERLLYFDLEKNLNEITKDSDLQEIVFNLIQTAESQEWLEQLIRAAYKENPDNSKLKKVAFELLSLETFSKTVRDEEYYIQHLYTQLQYFLEVKNWVEADQQTTKLMLNIARREKEGYLDYDSINTFSCPNLKRIDQLWVSNSNKHFGFSVQKEIWIATGNRLGIRPENWIVKDFTNYERFSREVGWYDETGIKGGYVSYDELLLRIKTNSFKSPRGSLPKNLAINYDVSNQGVLFADCDL